MAVLTLRGRAAPVNGEPVLCNAHALPGVRRRLDIGLVPDVTTVADQRAVAVISLGRALPFGWIAPPQFPLPARNTRRVRPGTRQQGAAVAARSTRSDGGRVAFTRVSAADAPAGVRPALVATPDGTLVTWFVARPADP